MRERRTMAAMSDVIEVMARGMCTLRGTMAGCGFPRCACRINPASAKAALDALTAAGYAVVKLDAKAQDEARAMLAAGGW